MDLKVEGCQWSETMFTIPILRLGSVSQWHGLVYSHTILYQAQTNIAEREREGEGEGDGPAKAVKGFLHLMERRRGSTLLPIETRASTPISFFDFDDSG